MPKVCTTVNLFDENRRVVTLHAGDEIPDWAVARITNPSVIAAEGTDTAPEPATVDTVEAVEVEPVDYSTFSKDALVAACAERGLDAKGNKPDLIARLTEADATDEGEEVDLFALTVDELKKIAAERGIDLGEASSDVEIATVIQQHEE